MTEAVHTFMGFDESTYLKLNPDVAEAVRNRFFASGLEHFITYGCMENRPGVAAEVTEAVQEITGGDSRYPPEHLRKRVHGDTGLPTFVNVGRIVAFKIHSIVSPLIELDSRHRVLDFGCGCGRVIQCFHKLTRNSQIFGTDIDAEAIAWCQRELADIGSFAQNGHAPPLPFGDEYFDLVYAISVFTHLPEDMQFTWLEELRRVTRPGGYLLLTTHGEELFTSVSADAGRAFRERGFEYSVGPGTEGLPDFYQTSFHTADYIHKRWGKFFEIREIFKKGIVNHQDIVLCRRPL